MPIKPFHISRIHTDAGIFRLSGEMDTSAPEHIYVSEADFMSTDGWRALDLHSDAAKALLARIMPLLVAHLRAT